MCQVPAYVAHANGYFADEGVAASIAIEPTAWMVPAKLARGESQFAVMPWTRAAAGTEQDLALVVVCGSGHEEAAIVVRQGIDVADVRRASIPQRGGMKDLTAMGLIESLGWKDVEIRRQPSGDGAIISFFGRGCDAASMVEPYATMMEQLGVGRVVKRTGDVWPGAPGCSLTTTRQLVGEDPGLVGAVVSAFVRGAQSARGTRRSGGSRGGLHRRRGAVHRGGAETPPTGRRRGSQHGGDRPDPVADGLAGLHRDQRAGLHRPFVSGPRRSGRVTLGPTDGPPEAAGLDPNEWAAVYETPRPNGHQLVFRAGAEIARRACLAFASPGERWLDVGCGTGHLAAALSAAGLRVTGVDSDSRMIAAAKARFPGLSFEAADASSLPSPDGSVDGVVATSVLGCLEDPAGFVAEAARVLRTAGTAVLTFTNRSSPLHAVGNCLALLEQRRSPTYAAARPLSAAEAIELLSQAGFAVERLRYYNCFVGTARGSSHHGALSVHSSRSSTCIRSLAACWDGICLPSPPSVKPRARPGL